MRINLRRGCLLSTMVFSLTACPAQDRFKSPSYDEKNNFLSTYGLGNEYVCNDYKEVSPYLNIQRIGRTFLEKDKVIKSSVAMSNFLETYYLDDTRAYDPAVYYFLSKLDDKEFGEYNLLISRTLVCNYEAFSYYFQNLYLKDNNLYIYLVYHDYLPPNVDVACVEGYEYLILYIKKNVKFQNIIFAVQNETEYRK